MAEATRPRFLHGTEELESWEVVTARRRTAYTVNVSTEGHIFCRYLNRRCRAHSTRHKV